LEHRETVRESIWALDQMIVVPQRSHRVADRNREEDILDQRNDRPTVASVVCSLHSVHMRRALPLQSPSGGLRVAGRAPRPGCFYFMTRLATRARPYVRPI